MFPYIRLRGGGTSPGPHDRRLFSDHRLVTFLFVCVSLVVMYAMSLRESSPTKLNVATWNLAAINNNPFEYWLTIQDDPKYSDLMSKVEGMVKNPGPRNVLVNEIFTEDMFRRLVKVRQKLLIVVLLTRIF